MEIKKSIGGEGGGDRVGVSLENIIRIEKNGGSLSAYYLQGAGLLM